MSPKKLVAVFAAIVLLSLTTSAERHYYYSGKTHTVVNDASSKSLPASPTPPSCTCSCGKNCDGSCVGSYAEGCGAFAGLDCILGCCAAAPNATPAECRGPGGILP
jgi:hypothetical protein